MKTLKLSFKAILEASYRCLVIVACNSIKNLTAIEENFVCLKGGLSKDRLNRETIQFDRLSGNTCKTQTNLNAIKR